jgi:hypothetical protein
MAPLSVQPAERAAHGFRPQLAHQFSCLAGMRGRRALSADHLAQRSPIVSKNPAANPAAYAAPSAVVSLMVGLITGLFSKY